MSGADGEIKWCEPDAGSSFLCGFGWGCAIMFIALVVFGVVRCDAEQPITPDSPPQMTIRHSVFGVSRDKITP